MRDFAKAFYNSGRWRAVRNNYWSKHPFCEDCLERGEINPTEIVHHIIELTPDNINDVSITLNEDNLRGVCRQCHGKKHPRDKNKRYKTDDTGRLIWN